ncbi:VanZ family protein [Arthrobacter sp. NPDC055585]
MRCAPVFAAVAAEPTEVRRHDAPRTVPHDSFELPAPVKPNASPFVRRRFFPAALFAFYLAALAVIALWPSPIDSGAAGSSLRTVLDWLRDHGAPGWFNYGFVEFSANVVLFVPFGLMASASLNRRWVWTVPVAGFCISGAIELGQFLLRPERFATLSDLVANTLGAAAGAALYAGYRIGVSKTENYRRQH